MKKLFKKKIFQLVYFVSKLKKRKFNKDIDLLDFSNKFSNPSEQYMYFHHHFWNILPTEFRNHRNYFTKNKRGFGEDAFHSMWYLIFEKFKPKNVLEIGVYRGQTLSLFSLLSNFFNCNSEIHGISPFTNSGDEVSTYLGNLDYYEDVINNFKYFNLKQAFLHKGFSNDKSMIQLFESKEWDMIYIDGNHDYEVAKYDFKISALNLKKGGLIILDDSALDTSYKPFKFSTAGHPGPSLVAREIDQNKFEEILSVGHNRVFLKK